MMDRSLTAFVLLGLAACSSEASKQATDAPASVAATSRPAAAPDQVPEPKAKADTPAAKQSEPDLAVEAEGLRLFDPATGAARALPFGIPQAQLLGILEAFRGPADGGTNNECGAGPLDYRAWADGLTLQFQDGTFAGWALDERAEGAHATVSGIGPGSTRRALDTAYEAEIEQSSLGTEFRAGGISGVLDGAKGDARIKAMWSGANCVFR